MKKTIYIMLMEEKVKLDAEKIFAEVYASVTKIGISLFITVLVAQQLIDVAYAERGYRAVGGEYIAIPIVFFGVYKVIGFIKRFLSVKVVKAWKRGK